MSKTQIPYITRTGHFNYVFDCNDPTLEDYAAILDYHKIGASMANEEIHAMIEAYNDHSGSNQVFVDKDYSDLLEYQNSDCTTHYLRYTLNEASLLVEPIEIPGDKTVSIYTVPLLRAFYILFNLEIGYSTDNMHFEFFHGRAEYRIGKEPNKIKNEVMIALYIDLSGGGKRYLGVYDVSIPPDNRRHK